MSLLNALPLKLYLKLLNSRGSKDFVSPAEAEGIGCEKSDEDKLIGLLRDLYGSNYISLSDKLYDRSLSVPYDEFRDAIYKEFRVSISHDTYDDFSTFEDMLEYISNHKWDNYGD